MNNNRDLILTTLIATIENLQINIAILNAQIQKTQDNQLIISLLSDIKELLKKKGE